jgi:hypothetical protein
MYTVASLAWDPSGRTLFYTTDNNAFRDVVALDPVTRKRRVLLKDARIGDLAFNPADRSLWGIRAFNGICTLVRIPYPWTEWKQVHSGLTGRRLATSTSPRTGAWCRSRWER